MDLNDFLSLIRQILDLRLFDIGGTSVTVATLITVALLALATRWASRFARRGVRRLLRRRGVSDEGTVGTASSVVNYLVLVVGFGIAIQTLGINLEALFAAGAIFAIGLGFAMQNIAQNFVAGVILLAERTIRPGDVLEVEKLVARVVQTGIRATIVRTLDGEELIVPNSLLVQNTVKNYTLRDASFRLRTLVGVNYGSDMQLVRQSLEEIVNDPRWSLPDQKPQVLLLEFGDNAVVFEAAVWMDDPWLARQALSDLNEAIWWRLRERGIEIAFPQLDVHFDAEVGEGLRSLGATVEDSDSPAADRRRRDDVAHG